MYLFLVVPDPYTLTASQVATYNARAENQVRHQPARDALIPALV